MMIDGHAFGNGFMWIFWIALIIVVVWGVNIIMKKNSGSSGVPSPMDILKQRYVKGEIDQAEFEKKRKDLGE